MARKRKEDAAATREGILDAAERVFASLGVAGATLQDIAVAAGVTRGAIYWHFQDKAALFDAFICERASLPLDVGKYPSGPMSAPDPLDALQEYVSAALRRTAGNERLQRLFHIAMLNVAIFDHGDAAQRRWQEIRRGWMSYAERWLTLAREAGLLAPTAAPRAIALAIWIMIDGLVRTWMLMDRRFDLVAQGASTLDTYMAGLRAGR